MLIIYKGQVGRGLMQNATSGMIMTYGEDMQVSSTSRGQGCWGSTKT